MILNLSFRRICGIASTAAVLMGAGAAAVATPASAQSAQVWPHAVVTVRTKTAFELNGVYSDGGTARPRIRDDDDSLMVDMSSQNRPLAKGSVVSKTQILVVFPDEAPHFGTLLTSGFIVWDNGSVWQKLTFVPDVRSMKKADAVAALQSAGLTAATADFPTCDTAAGSVDHQVPQASTPVVPGSQVKIYIAVKPTVTCT
jgi:PASTA domain